MLYDSILVHSPASGNSLSNVTEQLAENFSRTPEVTIFRPEGRPPSSIPFVRIGRIPLNQIGLRLDAAQQVITETVQEQPEQFWPDRPVITRAHLIERPGRRLVTLSPELEQQVAINNQQRLVVRGLRAAVSFREAGYIAAIRPLLPLAHIRTDRMSSRRANTLSKRVYDTAQDMLKLPMLVHLDDGIRLQPARAGFDWARLFGMIKASR